jgi:hypothetical protein
MRLSELKLSTQKELVRGTSDRKDSIEQWLIERGFRSLGSGGFGSVWTDDHKAVVKVFSGDPCYAAFVDFCQRNRGNPFLPRISKVFWRKDVPDVHRPERPPVSSWSSMPLDQFRDNRTGVVFMELLHRSGDEHEGMSRYIRSLGQMEPRAKDFVERYEAENPKLAETLRQLDALMKHLGSCQLDIRHFNVMRRADGSVVITDPIY